MRKVRKVLVKEGTNSAKHTQTLIYRAVFLYNKLPLEITGFYCKKKKYASKLISKNFANNSVPKNVIEL